jgi:hypothetical protein
MKGAKNTVDISVLKTIKNYAAGEGVTAQYIYKLIKDGRMNDFQIDGVQFIDTRMYPTLPVSNTRVGRRRG